MDDSLWNGNRWRGASLGRVIGGLLLSAVCLMMPTGLHALPVEEIYSFARVPSSHSELVEGSDGAFYGTTYGGGSSGLGTVYRVSPHGGMRTLVEFNSHNGASPEAGLVLGPDGALYGTTSGRGRGGEGTVFRVDTNGILTTLVEFYGTNGACPSGSLVRGRDGALYGTTSVGGCYYADNYVETVFRVTTNGTFSTLASFDSWFFGSPYSVPHGPLVEGRDGAFYGTTQFGGKSDCGLVFRVTTDGVLTALASFNSTNGVYPVGPLIKGRDGAFYGTTQLGGESGYGTIFRVTTNGVLTTLFSFDQAFGSFGRDPSCPLVEGDDGALYGIAASGGSKGYGAVIRVTTNGVLTVLVSFDGETNGANPQGRLVRGPDNRLYGAASGALFSLNMDGEFSVLNPLDWQTAGGYFSAGLVVGSDGALYGTSEMGGKYNYGTAFRCTLAGEVTVLAPFRHTEGGEIRGGLALGVDGSLYGTTTGGGSNGMGTIFRLDRHGQLTTLVTCQQESGAFPAEGLVPGRDGALYGTSVGGAGAVFRVTTNGDLTTLAGFGPTNGAMPCGKMVQGRDGALYGTTLYSGYDTAGWFVGTGTVFRVTTNGELSTLAFFNNSNWGYTRKALVQGFDGAFYGTTTEGGVYNSGSVFCVTTNGNFTTLCSFDRTNGASPSGLVLATNGAFYGTTWGGGSKGCGTVFKMTTDGVLTTLVAFDFSSGAYPTAGLVLGRDGALYGTTSATIFRVTTNGILTVLGLLNNTEGLAPEWELVFGSDGALYGTTYQGGSRGGGTIFRMALAPRMQPITLWSDGARRISFGGIPGDSYRLLRAVDIFGPWESLTSLTADPDGNGYYIDYEAPRDKAFYRVVSP